MFILLPFNFFIILSVSLPTSTLNITIVMTTVRAKDRAIISRGLNSPEKLASTQLPRNAPATVMVILPRKYERKNFGGLYFMSPNGMTTGSSGMGVAAAK